MAITDDPFGAVASMRKQGRPEEALSILRDSIRRGVLPPEGIDKAGRLIQKLRSEGGKRLSVRLLGQFTTSWLANALTAVAFGQGVDLEVSEGGYDNVMQELASTGAGNAPSIEVLLPWSHRLKRENESSSAKIDNEVAFWSQAWDLAARAGSRVLQVGHDWVVPDSLGLNLGRRDGWISLVRSTNDALVRSLPPGAYFLDLEAVSGASGRDRFYDMRRYYWTKQPFSEFGVVRLAESLWAGIRALTSGPKKVLVLDLDNTLWGGVVGEAGPLGVALGDSPEGESFQAFQGYCKSLLKRGILLAIASKNNPDDAHEPFRVNPDMLLSLDDFAAMEISWEPKGTTIARLAQTLNLGLDSFVFFDDNPAEREQVRQALPEVAVVEVPEDPSEYVRALSSGLWFEAVGLTDEDRSRAEQYAVERKRRELQQSFTSMDDYLRSLEMVADSLPIEESDLTRVVQLLGKTNQFNLTTRRHSREEVQNLLSRDGAFGLTLRVRDKFGDHGLVGLVLVVPHEDDPESLRIDTWLMSCRVIARTVEQFQLHEILRRARELGYRRIFGEYIPTKKNVLVARLLDDMGFVPKSEEADGRKTYLLDLETATPPKTFVTPGAGS